MNSFTKHTRLAPVVRAWSTRHCLTPARRYSSTNPTHSTAQGARDRSTVGVFTPTAALCFSATGVGLYYYFQYEKEQANLAKLKAIEEASANVGRANVGGPFVLTNANGGMFSDKDLIGKWNLLYFGFTNCPDICPAELDKMGVVLDELEKTHGQIFQPLFISVDPARDPPSTVKRYLSDFHPRFIGLTASKVIDAPEATAPSKKTWWNPFGSSTPGPAPTEPAPSASPPPASTAIATAATTPARTPAQEAYALTKAVCKTYRVYFSTPPLSEATDDYLVDHSIFVYFMDPNGEFVDAYGQSVPAEEIVERVSKEISEGGRGQSSIRSIAKLKPMSTPPQHTPAS